MARRAAGAALFGIIAQPIIPNAAATILDALNVPADRRSFDLGEAQALIDALPHGHEIAPPDVLFKKIEDADIEAWSQRFGGAQ